MRNVDLLQEMKKKKIDYTYRFATEFVLRGAGTF